MRYRRRDKEPTSRRSPRSEAFRSRDLVKVLRVDIEVLLKEAGFKRLGDRGWIRPEVDGYLILAVQCRQSGWDPRAGGRFIVEIEQTTTPKIATGRNRNRLWRLLDEPAREAALAIVNEVAATLPEPDERFVAALPPEVQDHYLLQFSPTAWTVESSDVWFTYYDELDAERWAGFLADSLPSALDNFRGSTPSFMGFEP